ncbi:unnamed protein product [Discosporangium mesarthrocarpum]
MLSRLAQGRAAQSRAEAAAVMVQAMWRGRLARGEAGQLREGRLAAVVILQALFRGVVGRRAAATERVIRAVEEEKKRQAREEGMATVLQAWWRALVGRKTYLRRLTGAVTMQRWWRSTAARVERDASSAAVVIQSMWRGVCTRHRVARESVAAAAAKAAEEERVMRKQAWAAAVVQGAWHKQCIRSVAKTRSAVEIQAWWRGRSAKAKFGQSKWGVIALQAQGRGAESRRRVGMMRPAAVRLTAWWRCTSQARRFRVAHRGIVRLQSTVRGRMARQVVGELRESRRLRISEFHAATVIQSVCRGHRARLRAGELVALARARLAEAEARAIADPSQTLGARVESALWALENGSHLTQVIRACLTLELSSRYSKVCCQVLAESRAPSVIYSLVRSLNRSPPHQKILKYIITTFRNVVMRGGNSLARLVAAPADTVETYMDLLQMYRDRPEMFQPTVRLLQQLVAAHEPTKFACNVPKNLQRIETISDILRRKAASEAKSAASRRAAGGAGSEFAGRSAKSLKVTLSLLKEITG